MIDYLTLDWSDVILGVFMAQLLVCSQISKVGSLTQPEFLK